MADGKMKLVSSISYMQRLASGLKKEGARIGFVPTMGALHKGHLSLIREGRKKADILIVSIFVNPAQFGPNEDYKKYPRPFNRDKKLAEKLGVDILFCPKPGKMYPNGYSTYTVEEKLSRVMCGRSRPGHFKGVTTVVLKLFNIVQSDIAFFGQKDYQQALIIKRMVTDLNLPVKINILPIVRDQNGLALSSRNKYLSKKEYQKALLLYKMLKERKIIRDKAIRMDYFVIADKETLKPVKKIKKGKTLIAVAAWVGKTRLIDNVLV